MTDGATGSVTNGATGSTTNGLATGGVTNSAGDKWRD